MGQECKGERLYFSSLIVASKIEKNPGKPIKLPMLIQGTGGRGKNQGYPIGHRWMKTSDAVQITSKESE